jgi:peptide/nickel transport system substrate-binding protein
MLARNLGLSLAGAVLLLAAPGLALAADAFAPTPLTPDQVGTGPKLVYLASDYPATLDPQNTSAFMGELSMEFWDTLVTYEIDPATGIADQTRIKPRLAKSWDISSDNKTLTFHLDERAKFWDGTPVTADDVYFSIQRALEGKMGWGTTQIQTGGIFKTEQMKVVDPHTLVITYPDGMGRYSLRNFASMSLTVLSKAACEKGAAADDKWCVDWIKKNAMGSGPYMLGSSKDGQYITAVANKNYWGDAKPFYSEVTFRVVPDVQNRTLLMQSGDADFATLSPDQYAALKGASNVKLFSVPSQQDVAVMRWKPDVPPFDDPKIREAVVKAIPYGRIVSDACLGFCTPVQNLIGVNTPGYKPDPLFSTDIEAAKKLVAESKYAGKVPSFEVPLVQGTLQMNAAVIVQDALRGIGLDMQIKPLTQNAYDDIAWNKRDLKVSIHSMGPWWNDFMYWAYWMYRTDSATNHIRYSNPTLDKDVLSALQIPQSDTADYNKLEDEVLGILTGERMAAPLYQVNWTEAVSSRLCDINKFPWGTISIEYLRPCN